ncbi:AAEL010420-PA [Aedes aegypti]|uniref:AAEL010420-PA n=1 Tax=Aedes aegypti TaxID=7159 RepID=Q16T19_AEDAE|nr:AAEL010420-PA [Aedes aegypti]
MTAKTNQYSSLCQRGFVHDFCLLELHFPRAKSKLPQRLRRIASNTFVHVSSSASDLCQFRSLNLFYYGQFRRIFGFKKTDDQDNLISSCEIPTSEKISGV